MHGKLQTIIFLITMLLAVSTSALAQKRNEIKPPPETASLAEVQQWLVGAIPKYATHKTRMEAVALSNVKLEGCSLNFTQTRKLGTVSTATMGTTRTTNVLKNDISIDLAKVRPDGISLEDHIYPELRSVKLWYSGFDLSPGSTEGRINYIVVKTEAAEAIKTALVQVKRLCTAAK